MGRVVAVVCPLLIVAILTVRIWVKPFANWVLEVGMPAHIISAFITLALVIGGIVAAFMCFPTMTLKATYLVLLLLTFVVMGMSHMSEQDSTMHVVALVGMFAFPIIAAVIAMFAQSTVHSAS